MVDFDPGYIAAMAVIVVIAAPVLIHLLPLLFTALWQIMPGVLILFIIVSVFRGMMKKFFE